MARLIAFVLAAVLVAPLAARADDPPAVRPPPPPPGQTLGESAPHPGDVSRQEFVVKLTPYGRWVQTPEYGQVFIPNGLSPGWRPYAFGHWVLTDWGWTWASDEPWGWATYHYGRWWWGASLGWYWIPARRWGPAWVSWRWNAGYVAWAPLVPRGRVFWGATSPYWVTVQSQHFTQPIRTVALPPQRAAPIVAQMRPLGGVYARPVQGHFGPPVSAISRAVGRPITPVAASRVVPGAMAHAQSGNVRAAPPSRPPNAPGTVRRGAPGKRGGAPGWRGGRGRWRRK